jgi:hypothetical protein
MHIRILISRIDEYIKNNISLLRSKIRELHPVHRASLEALLRHLLHVASHSDKNRMTVEDSLLIFCRYYLRVTMRSSKVNIDMEARCIELAVIFPADTLGGIGYGGSYSKCTYLVRRAPLSVTTCSLIHCGRDNVYQHL